MKLFHIGKPETLFAVDEIVHGRYPYTSTFRQLVGLFSRLVQIFLQIVFESHEVK